MVQTGKQTIGPPATYVFSGTIVSYPDAWGNQFPVSQTLVELQTSDANYISLKNPFQIGALTITDTLTGNGFFRLVSPAHPAIIPLDSLSLQMTNVSTQNLHRHSVNWQFIQRSVLGAFNQINYDLGKIQAPFPAEVPQIASVNGVGFEYPADFARRLASTAGPFRWSGTIELRRSFEGAPDPAPDIDDLFFALEKVSTGVTKEKFTSRLASALVPILKINLMNIRYSTDVFLTALKHYSNTRFNTLNIKDFQSDSVGKATQTAFRTTKFLNFFGLEGRAAFCALLFIAGRVAYGQQITVSTGEDGTDWVTTIFVM